MDGWVIAAVTVAGIVVWSVVIVVADAVCGRFARVAARARSQLVAREALLDAYRRRAAWERIRARVFDQRPIASMRAVKSVDARQELLRPMTRAQLERFGGCLSYRPAVPFSFWPKGGHHEDHPAAGCAGDRATRDTGPGCPDGEPGRALRRRTHRS